MASVCFPIWFTAIRTYSGLSRYAIHALYWGRLVSENNCIKYLHSFKYFDLITFNGLRPVISLINEG